MMSEQMWVICNLQRIYFPRELYQQLKERTNRIIRFIESRSDLITEYNDTLVRYFVEKILVYEDRLSVELKTGDSVDIML